VAGLNGTFKKWFLVLLVMSGVGGLVLGSDFHRYPEKVPVAGTSAAVVETGLEVEHRSNKLRARDLLSLQPGSPRAGQAEAPISGIDDEDLILFTLKAGMAAAMAEDLDESLRFISADYCDDLGFNFNLMRGLLERAYEEFDKPRIELTEPPQIQIRDRQAVVLAQISLTAIYNDRRNYLLGNRDHPNTILLVLEKSTNNWKISKIEGLQPLGFEEHFFKLLGAELGLVLTAAEREQKQQACMPCRRRMIELFGIER
jgi:hypothetical protein